MTTISEFDHAVAFHSQVGDDFSIVFDYFISSPGAYFFRGPGFLVMGEPRDEHEGVHRPHWFIYYFYHDPVRSGLTIASLLSHFPYPLPEIAFQRGLRRKGLKFYDFDRFMRIHGRTIHKSTRPCAVTGSGSTDPDGPASDSSK